MNRSRRQRIRKGLILVSFLLFPITIYYFSPVLVLESAAVGVVNGSLIVFALLFLSSLVLGRGWCGWVCPGGGLGEACSLAWNAPAPGGKWNLIKYFLWVPWVGAIVFLAFRAGGYGSWEPFWATYYGISVHDPQSYIVYFFFVALIAFLAWYPGRRGFCHYVCWMAPFMVLGESLRRKVGWPGLHLEVDPDRCTGCNTCASNCPMSLDVPALVSSGSMADSECILCGTCVDNCGQGTIRFAWKNNASAGPPRS